MWVLGHFLRRGSARNEGVKEKRANGTIPFRIWRDKIYYAFVGMAVASTKIALGIFTPYLPLDLKKKY